MKLEGFGGKALLGNSEEEGLAKDWIGSCSRETRVLEAVVGGRKEGTPHAAETNQSMNIASYLNED